jgi:hypothetical protein
MTLKLLAALGLLLAATPALAIDSAATSITCAAAVTTGIGGNQALKDLEPSELPVLAYADVPKDQQFKQLTKIDAAPIRLYVYRVNATLLHMQIFQPTDTGKAVLADTPLSGDVSELTWAPLGGREQVTVDCY